MNESRNRFVDRALFFHMLAWLEDQMVRDRLQWSRVSGFAMLCDQVQRTLLDTVLAYLDGDVVITPTLLALARCRLARMNIAALVRTLIDDVPDTLSCLITVTAAEMPPMLKAPPSPGEETTAFCEALVGSRITHEYLTSMSQSWQGNSCLGAQNLRMFIGRRLELQQWARPLPLFLYAMLQSSLETLDWHRVAAAVMQVNPISCQCAARPDTLLEARVAWLAELCWEVQEVVSLERTHLPEALRADLEAFEERCIELSELFDLLLKDGKARAIPPEQLLLFG
jgi:hypothetical protein